MPGSSPKPESWCQEKVFGQFGHFDDELLEEEEGTTADGGTADVGHQLAVQAGTDAVAGPVVVGDEVALAAVVQRGDGVVEHTIVRVGLTVSPG